MKKHYPKLEMTIDAINKCYYVMVNDRPVARFNVLAAANAMLDDFITQYIEQ